MLGDIVSNNSRPNGGTATAARPAATPRPEAGGYGTSSFGDPRPTSPVAASIAQPQPLRVQPQPLRPVAQPAASPAPSQPAQQTATGVQSTPTTAPQQSAPVITALPPVKTKKASKVPLILTIVGVVVFIGGVSGLFIYALGGK